MIIALKDLKTQYKNGEVSALVGAGFSKNVDSKLFPNWSQLLEDMVLFTYEDEINQSYREYRHIEETTKLQSFQTYRKNIIKEITRRDGYLKIVDKYIHKKGFREAVETYIEERTPRIFNFDDNESPLKLLCSKISKEPITIPDERLNLHHKLLSCSWDNIFTTNYDGLLEYVVKHRSLPWDSKPIINSSQLSFRSKKPIIKIHGSLADDMTTEFCFDNDHNKRYVICSDDYDTYPTKHEAFTQYMRISLLKGCFCLFGFSGDDQNFISWTKWVRDILVKAPLKDEGHTNIHKVFLLSIDDDLPSREKQLFYDNHKIAYIPLKNASVKKELGLAEDETSISVIYNAFFDYLLKSEVSESENDYIELWRRVAKIDTDITNGKRITRSEIDIPVFNEIIEKQSIQRFVKRTDRQEYILHDLYIKEELDENEVKIIVAALKDMQLLPSNYRDIRTDIDKLEPLSNIATINDYEKLSAREKTIRGQKVVINHGIHDFENYYYYEQSLNYALNLDFTSLKEGLAGWDAKGVWSQRKATLLALFNEDESKSLLLDYVDNTSNYTEKYYATDLLNFIFRTHPTKFPTEDFKHKKIDGIYDYFDYFIENIKNQKEKITPLGDTRVTYSMSKETTKFQSALRLLQSLFDLGAPISLKSSRLINDNDWYHAFKELYPYYPLATLFYSIQVSDKDILKRIGQEYAYNNALFEEGVLPVLVDKLLTAYLNPDTPNFYKRGILYIASELFVAVPATKWQSLFISIWDKFFIPNYGIDRRRIDDLYDFIIAGLPFITPRYSKKIITDCLNNAASNSTMAVDCLYHLKAKRAKVVNYESDAEYQSTVNHFINNITSPEDFTILGNIYDSLSKLQKDQIAEKVASYIENNKDVAYPTYTLVSLSYFAKGHKAPMSALKTVIINHANLFYNGISKEGHFSYGDETLKISQISNNIDWTQKELLMLYKKLSNSITELTGSRWFEDSEDRFFPIDHVPLLKEMYSFLDKFQSRLNIQTNFNRIFGLVRSSLIEKRKFINIEEALISDDYKVIANGINELIEKIEITGIDANLRLINLLIDRVLFKRPEALIVAINAVWYILYKHKQRIFTEFGGHLILILETYKGNVCFDLSLDIPKAYSYLIKIASILQTKGAQSSVISYWNNIKTSKRFNL